MIEVLDNMINKKRVEYEKARTWKGWKLYEKKKEQGERHLKTYNRMAIFKKRLKDYKEDFIFYTSLRFSLLRGLECIPHLSQGAEI